MYVCFTRTLSSCTSRWFKAISRREVYIAWWVRSFIIACSTVCCALLDSRTNLKMIKQWSWLLSTIWMSLILKTALVFGFLPISFFFSGFFESTQSRTCCSIVNWPSAKDFLG